MRGNEAESGEWFHLDWIYDDYHTKLVAYGLSSAPVLEDAVLYRPNARLTVGLEKSFE